MGYLGDGVRLPTGWLHNETNPATPTISSLDTVTNSANSSTTFPAHHSEVFKSDAADTGLMQHYIMSCMLFSVLFGCIFGDGL
jgi:hypothetical protein